MNPQMLPIMANNVAILISNIPIHTQNTRLVCLDSVKVKTSDFGVRDRGSIPTRSAEKIANPNKFFLKARVGKLQLHQLFDTNTSAAIGQLARQAGRHQQQQRRRQQQREA